MPGLSNYEGPGCKLKSSFPPKQNKSVSVSVCGTGCDRGGEGSNCMFGGGNSECTLLGKTALATTENKRSQLYVKYWRQFGS